MRVRFGAFCDTLCVWSHDDGSVLCTMRAWVAQGLAWCHLLPSAYDLPW